MTRAIMTRDELAAAKTTAHGRDHVHSGDGYDDMELAGTQGWHVVSSWGRDGWDLGEWPYVTIYVRDINDGTLDGGKLRRIYQMQQITEGDHTVYAFDTPEDRDAAIDYLFLWYAAGRDWAPLGYEQREDLDAGQMDDLDAKWRGAFSWGRLDAEKAG